MLLLLRHGADPHQKNDEGETPIDVAEGDDILEALQNFTKEMLSDLKPIKGIFMIWVFKAPILQALCIGTLLVEDF